MLQRSATSKYQLEGGLASSLMTVTMMDLLYSLQAGIMSSNFISGVASLFHTLPDALASYIIYCCCSTRVVTLGQIAAAKAKDSALHWVRRLGTGPLPVICINSG